MDRVVFSLELHLGYHQSLPTSALSFNGSQLL